MADNYERRVEEAEEAATEAVDPDERQAFEQVAELWRELAQLKRDRAAEKKG